MKHRAYLYSISIVSLVLAAVPVSALAQTASTSKDLGSETGGVPSAAMPAFPPSENCSEFRPCRSVMGEIVRIEESYWIRQPNGSETHLTVTPETKMGSLPKVGDKIAAQVRSAGKAEAVVKLEELPERKTLDIPESKHSMLR